MDIENLFDGILDVEGSEVFVEVWVLVVQDCEVEDVVNEEIDKLRG